MVDISSLKDAVAPEEQTKEKTPDQKEVVVKKPEKDKQGRSYATGRRKDSKGNYRQRKKPNLDGR